MVENLGEISTECMNIFNEMLGVPLCFKLRPAAAACLIDRVMLEYVCMHQPEASENGFRLHACGGMHCCPG